MRNTRRTHLHRLILLPAAAIAPLAQAGTPPYPVTITDDGRYVFAYTEINSMFMDQTHESNATGSFGAQAMSQQARKDSTARAQSKQESTMSPINFSGTGNAIANSVASPIVTNYMAGESVYSVTFEVMATTAYQLEGSLAVVSAGNQSEARARVELYTTQPFDTLFSDEIDVQKSTDLRGFTTSGSLEPGTYELIVRCQASVIETENEISSATANFSFSMSLGDTDGDGLLDAWETQGIDADGNGTIDLDLPALGANPLRKDIFVEVDAMTGRNPAPMVLARVTDAFANAPVSNPDGSTGITLHATLDDSAIPLVDFPNNFAQFDPLKDQFFGTAAQRADTNWPNIKLAREWVYRYCIFANTYDGGTSSGLAELPGNDFMVTLGGWTTPGGTPDQQAGTFMHELGHNLGLRHSGGLDRNSAGNLISRNYKPNYYSVMNYLWQSPHDPYASSWRLDYSRSALPALNESALIEFDGINGDGPEHETSVTPFSAGDGTIRYARFSNAYSTDWNANGMIDDNSVAVDIDRDTANTPGDTLFGHNDWAVLWYHLSGHPNFSDGVHTQLPSHEKTLADFLAIEAYPTAPATCPGDTNNDNTVNLADLNAVLALFGQPTTSGADLDNSGAVDLADLNIVLSAFGESCTP